jgi:adenosine deaminase
MNLREIPKVDLHRHLDCSMRVETMRELARELRFPIPYTDPGFRDAMLVETPMQDLESVLKKFTHVQNLFASAEILTRMTYECIEDAALEGIKILELRYAPTFIQAGRPDWSFEFIHRAIAAGIEKAAHLPVAVGIILIVQRVLPVDVGAKVIDFAILNRGDKATDIMAIDLADNEASADSQPFAVDFLRAKKNGLHITVHAGEALFPGAAENVKYAIEHLGAERIGHGLQIHSSPEVISLVREKNIILELCPTSNWLTNAVPSMAEHPIRKLMAAGVQVTVNTDDPGVFALDLTHEYEVLMKTFGFTFQEFEQLGDAAARASFIPLLRRQRHWPRPI